MALALLIMVFVLLRLAITDWNGRWL